MCWVFTLSLFMEQRHIISDVMCHSVNGIFLACGFQHLWCFTWKYTHAFSFTYKNTIMHLLVSCTFKQRVPTKNSNFNILRTAVMLLKLDSKYTDSTQSCVYIINVILCNLATISIYINSMACKTYLIIICFINHKYSIFIKHINLLCQIIWHLVKQV